MCTLIFLKLGGSLITDKNKPFTANRAALRRLAGEIASARKEGFASRLLIGHGSGSFGHTAGSCYHTRLGVHSQADWEGFWEVWRAARLLNQIVVEELSAAGLAVIAFPPSACAAVATREIRAWNLEPLHQALDAGLIPLLNGDVVFDDQLGGTILSTEEVFAYLCPILQAGRILLAGREPGVWADFPACTRLVHDLNPGDIREFQAALLGSAAVDTTGGMLEKVNLMAALVDQNAGLQAQVFSGLEENLLLGALKGEKPGTCISAGAAGGRSRP